MRAHVRTLGGIRTHASDFRAIENRNDSENSKLLIMTFFYRCVFFPVRSEY
jgi:transcriptional regulator with AAA-type ATPase domain